MLKELLDGKKSGKDAIDLLMNDHRQVESLFKQFEGAEDDKREKRRIAREICAELGMHAKIEEQILYPEAARKIEEAKDKIDEGIVEHAGIKRLIKEIPRMSAGDDLFDAKVKVLKEYVQHHVKEEESETFPLLRRSELDLSDIGDKLAQRKERLQRAASRAPSSASTARRSSESSAHRAR